MIMKNVKNSVMDLLPASSSQEKGKISKQDTKPKFDDYLKKQQIGKQDSEKAGNSAPKSKNKIEAPSAENFSKPVKREGIKSDTKDGVVKQADLPNNLVDETELGENMVSYMEQIMKQTLMNALHVSEKEIDQLLETSGFSLLDLFDPENLTAFYLQMNGVEDSSQILTDENLAASLTDLLNQVKNMDVEAELGITKEEWGQILEEALKKEQSMEGQNLVTSEEKAPVHKEDITQKLNPSPEKQELGNPIQNPEETQADHKSLQEQDAKEQGKEEKPQTEGAKNTTENVFSNLVRSVENSQTFAGQIREVISAREIVSQIVEQVKVNVRPESTTMEMQLHPESLGRVHLSVTAKDGVMTAHFTVQNEVAREAIESQIQTLRDTLGEQGLKVDAIEVTVSNLSYDQSGQTGGEEKGQRNPNRRRNLNLEGIGKEEPEEELTEELLTENILQEEGSQINYMA